MTRIENSFSDYQIGDPSDTKAKLRVIKQQFCVAASLPQHIRDNIRHCGDLDDVVVCVIEDMAKLKDQQQQSLPDVMQQGPVLHSQHQQQHQYPSNQGQAVTRSSQFFLPRSPLPRSISASGPDWL